MSDKLATNIIVVFSCFGRATSCYYKQETYIAKIWLKVSYHPRLDTHSVIYSTTWQLWTLHTNFINIFWNYTEHFFCLKVFKLLPWLVWLLFFSSNNQIVYSSSSLSVNMLRYELYRPHITDIWDLSQLFPCALHVPFLLFFFSDMPVYPAVVASAEPLSVAVTLI